MHERDVQQFLSHEQKEYDPYDQIASIAESYLGYPAGPYPPQEGIFTCSSFVSQVLQEAGVEVPNDVRFSNVYFDVFGISVHKELRSRGDLIFFSYDKGVRPTHMGIVTSFDEYIHAPGKPGEVIKKSKIVEKQIISDKPDQRYIVNPIGYKQPSFRNGRYNHRLG